jgi:cell division protease FtsH
MDKKAFIWLIAVVIGALLIGRMLPSSSQTANPAAKPAASATVEQVQFSDLNQMLSKSPSEVKKITFVNGSNEVIVEREGKPAVKVAVPAEGKQLVIAKAADAQVAMDAKDDAKKEPSGWDYLIAILVNFGPMILIFLLIFWFIGRAARNQQAQIQQQLSRGSGQQDQSRIQKKTFADVAGCDEAIKKLQRVVKFLKGKHTFSAFGARLPKGVLLAGPSGTGKTLLAKAVAGETDGVFLSMSGSDFVEMFVGVGASRVRELFKQARAEAERTKKPVVLFIDEIDAVGGKRSSGTAGGGHQEREQTLNAILVEMDGMQANTGIIVLAATNRIDILDPALIRPGRFDYHVLVDLPDILGREKIFGIHTKGKPLAPDVDLKVLAARTYGYSGADIEAACNEAAILAAERVEAQVAELRIAGKNEQEINAAVVRGVTLLEFDEGIDSTKYGEARVSRLASMTEDEKWNTTVHEMGHGWLSSVVEGGDPVVKITNVPRERALGYTQSQPEGDRVSYTRKQALSRIIMAMGGRVAQEIFLGTIDTGASNDFKQATGIAKKMVTEWGMSSLGHINVGDDEGPSMAYAGAGVSYGQQLANDIDKEWRAINEDCYAKARLIIELDRESILAFANRLKVAETILAPEWKALLVQHPSKLAGKFNPEMPLDQLKKLVEELKAKPAPAPAETAVAPEGPAPADADPVTAVIEDADLEEPKA